MKWKVNMFRIFNINDFTIYVAIENCEKRDIKRNLEDYIQDQFDEILVYNLGTNEIEVNNEIMILILSKRLENSHKIVEIK